MLAVGDRLGRTLAEVGAMPVSEFLLWAAFYFERKTGA